MSKRELDEANGEFERRVVIYKLIPEELPFRSVQTIPSARRREPRVCYLIQAKEIEQWIEEARKEFRIKTAQSRSFEEHHSIIWAWFKKWFGEKTEDSGD